jgi:virulence-associated protein VagC
VFEVEMPVTHIVEVFTDGVSRALRLPPGFHFDGGEVYATRDEAD